MAVFDLHVHTVLGSSDSSLTPEQLVEEARRIGLDGVCIAEHGGWPRPEVARVFQEAGLTVVRAMEVDTDMGHVIVLGLHTYTPGMHRARELRRAVERVGGFMIAAHPFRNLFNGPPYNSRNLLYPSAESYPKTASEAAGHPVFSLVDEVEVANGSNTAPENRFALEVARELGFVGTGGSDAHSVHGLGRCVTVFEGEIRHEADLLEALRARAFRHGQGFHLGRLQPIG